MLFWKDLILPIFILVLAIGAIISVINLVFRAIHLDIAILKIVAFFAIWYFVGPIIYQWMVDHIFTYESEAIKILYMPIQYLMGSFKKIV